MVFAVISGDFRLSELRKLAVANIVLEVLVALIIDLLDLGVQ